ncbi:MAG: alpha/beta hydrolase fold domain-containing protein [Pseudomonadota bacterium]
MLKLDPRLMTPSAVDPETAAFNDRLEEQLAALPAQHELPVETTRRARAEGRGIFPLTGPAAGSGWDAPDGVVPLRISLPVGAPRGVYLHVHGGGWTFNRPDYYDLPNQRIARDTGLVVASVQYRLAPEHAWPAPLEDVLAGLERVRKLWPGLPVALGGESAGGHLSAAALAFLRRAGALQGLVGAVLNYGIYDLRMTASMANWGGRKLVLNTPVVAWFLDNLIPDPAMRTDPVASPLLSDLTGMPPALFQVGTLDPLLDDTLQLAARWAGAGAHAELALWPGGVHAFDAFDLAIAEGFRARQSAFLTGLF